MAERPGWGASTGPRAPSPIRTDLSVRAAPGRRAPPRDLRRRAGDGGPAPPEPPLGHVRDGDPGGDRRDRPLARRRPRGLRADAPQGRGSRDPGRLAGGAGAEEGRRALREARHRPHGPIPARRAGWCANLTSERYRPRTPRRATTLVNNSTTSIAHRTIQMISSVNVPDR